MRQVLQRPLSQFFVNQSVYLCMLFRLKCTLMIEIKVFQMMYRYYLVNRYLVQLHTCSSKYKFNEIEELFENFLGKSSIVHWMRVFDGKLGWILNVLTGKFPNVLAGIFPKINILCSMFIRETRVLRIATYKEKCLVAQTT